MTRLNVLLLAALVLSALALVHSQYESRQLFMALEAARKDTSRLEIERDRLLVELAGSPNAHHGKPHATSSNDPLAADAESCLRDPRPPADMMAMPEHVSVE